MGTIISRFAEKPTSDDKPECIAISAETYKCIEISSFVPTCINIMSSIPSEPTPTYDPWERPEQEPSEAPVLTSLETCVADGDIIGVLIENFDPNALYVNLRATNGFLSPPYLYGDTIVWTFDNDIDCGETETVEIQVIQMDKTISPIGSYSVVGKCKIDAPILSGQNSAIEGDKVIITIDNYDETVTYSVSNITVGAAEIVGSTIEWKIPSVDITITGGTIGVIATSSEPCKLPSDPDYHTINIYQDTCYYASLIGYQSNINTNTATYTSGAAGYGGLPARGSAVVTTGYLYNFADATTMWSYPSTVMTYTEFRALAAQMDGIARNQSSPDMGQYNKVILDNTFCDGRVQRVGIYEITYIYPFVTSDYGSVVITKQNYIWKYYTTYEYTYA